MARDVAAVTRISPTGERTVIVQTGGRRNGLAVDARGNFWVAGGPARLVRRYDPQGRLLARIEGSAERLFLFPNDIAFGPDGALFVNESITGAILRVNPDGATSQYADVSPPDDDGFGPDGMAFAADGTLYCAIYGSGHIAVVPPSGGSAASRIEPPAGRPPTSLLRATASR